MTHHPESLPLLLLLFCPSFFLKVTLNPACGEGIQTLVSSGGLVCICHDAFLWCYLCFVLLRSRLYAFVEATALRSTVLRYAGAPIATRVSFFFPFVYLEMSLFPSILCTIAVLSLNGECVVRSFLPGGIFLPCDHELDFFTSAYYVRIQSNKNTR